jgi:hypothetical protein
MNKKLKSKETTSVFTTQQIINNQELFPYTNKDEIIDWNKYIKRAINGR